MKTLKKISVLLALSLLSSGVFAQSCDLTIYDNSNTSGQTYNLVFELWNYTSTPATWINTENTSGYWGSSGDMVQVQLTYQLEPDIARLKFRVWAQNTSTGKWGNAWSQQTFDSDDYYNNSPPVTVTVP